MFDISIVFLTFSIHRKAGRSLQGTVFSVWDFFKKFYSYQSNPMFGVTLIDSRIATKIIVALNWGFFDNGMLFKKVSGRV